MLKKFKNSFDLILLKVILQLSSVQLWFRWPFKQSSHGVSHWDHSQEAGLERLW